MLNTIPDLRDVTQRLIISQARVQELEALLETYTQEYEIAQERVQTLEAEHQATVAKIKEEVVARFAECEGESS